MAGFAVLPSVAVTGQRVEPPTRINIMFTITCPAKPRLAANVS